ncbi:restriction endonuclease subunit S [Streptomyces albogriseolus]|uniref:restriction endonuclease subunit S n=1 Tax=Streptomyces albogriseolus TaxID=1887 RepID=UPI002259F1AD|nr:restriction endonuclease subunit S [Streptomyces viridodiastaticus]MCX4570323.1 restriction endonuclease subunit S [Streptomyces viridodiastaticus]
MTTTRHTQLGWAPTIPSHWKVVPLSFVAKMGTGHTPDRTKKEYWENCTVPWVTTPDVSRRGNSLAPLMETEQKISELGMANSAAVLHSTDTVMLSRTASIGYSVRIGRPMATTQAFVTWSAGPSLDSRYLLLVLRAMKQEWQKLAYGSTHLTIYMPDLEALRVPLPPLDEQRRIADFLDAENARIDKMLTTGSRLQQILQERRDVQQSLLLRGASKSGGRTFHPILGDLPDSWPIVPLKRLVPRIGVGVVVDPSSYFSDEGVPFLRGSNITPQGIDLTDVKRMSESDSRALWRSRLTTGDVVVIRAGYPGRAAVVPEELNGANCASLIVLKKGDRLLPEYLEAYFNSPLGKAYVDSVRYGAAQEQINVSHVVDFMVPVPAPDEQAALVAELAQAGNKVRTLQEKATRQEILLEERRQALITAAVTGQFDVSTASGRNVTEGVSA